MDGLVPLARGPLEVQKTLEEKKAQHAARINMTGDVLLSNLLGYMTSGWQAALEFKRETQQIMLICAQQIKGEYSAAKLSEIRAFGGSEVFMGITEEKCRASKAWIKDIIKETNKKPWILEPTPIPELPTDLDTLINEKIAFGIQTGEVTLENGLESAQEQLRDELMQAMKDDAEETIDRMQAKILDEQLQGEWHKALDEFISDVVDYPAGILKGPIFRRKKVLKWGKDAQGNSIPQVEEVIEKHWYRVSPFSYYPLPMARNIQDGGFEHHRLTRESLEGMRGQPGYDTKAIDRILEKSNRGQLSDWVYIIREQEEAEGTKPYYFANKGPENKIDAIEHWGHIKGKDLIEWGMSTKKIKDPNKSYQANIWKIDNEIIKAVLNPHPLGNKPYFMCSFSKITGAFWGKGVPQLMIDIQNIVNAVARALINNVAIASGPQVSKDVALLAPGENPKYISPWQVHLYSTAENMGMTANTNPIQFFQPTMNARPLMELFKFFTELADDYTGIPSYTYGVASGGGALATASGLSMMITAAGKVINNVMLTIDNSAIALGVAYHYDLLMLFDEDQSIKGDVRVIANGVTTLVAKEQQIIRLTEMANMLNNPMDNAILGIKGRTNLLRMIMEQFPVNVNDIIPSDEIIMKRQEEMARAEAEEAAVEGAGTGDKKKPNELSLAGEPAAGGDHALFTQTRSA